MKLISLAAMALLAAGCATAHADNLANPGAGADGAPLAARQTELDSRQSDYEPMKIFEGMAGRVWRGEGTAPDGQPIVDIAIHEFILGGRAFQSTHKLEGGTYGGRTIFFYDEGAKDYIFHYFTTAGFHTTGTMDPVEGGFSVTETVKGHSKYAEVRSTMIVDGDDLRVLSQHVTHAGEVSDRDERVYKALAPRDYILFFDEADALFGKRTEVRTAQDRYDEQE